MEGKVPGGRQRSLTVDDFTADDEEEGGVNAMKLSQHHRQVSLSLPKFNSNECKQDPEATPDEFSRSQTLGRRKKHKPQGAKSTFGGFMQKIAKHMSNLTTHSSPKTKFPKKRSLSLGPERRRRIHNDSPATPDDKQSNGTHCGKLPGIIGIRNHGNTCFMNAVLQCLSHTELLAEYFVTDQFKYDIKRNNKLNAKKYGTHGELTEHLGLLLKSLWSGQYSAEISNDFKAVVGKYGAQYRGFAQHDAQEFFLWLLDKVHEDLNVATKKKYRSNKSGHGRSDETIAAEALANHMRCNNSFVYDLFQALYRSSLTCPNCRRHSNTFDPFLSVSLPIPQKTKRPLYVTVVYLDAQPKQVRIGLLMGQTDSVYELRQTLSNDTRIPEQQLVLTEIYHDGFHRTFHDDQPLSDLQETDNIYAIETPSPLVETGPDDSQYLGRYLVVLLLNQLVDKDDKKQIGSPLVLQVERDTTFMDLQKDVLVNMASTVRPGITTQPLGVLFRLRVLEGLPDPSCLPDDVQHPLYMPTIDKALSCHITGSGPIHVKLLAEWTVETADLVLSSTACNVEEHASVQQVRIAHQQPVLGTLDECFRLYTEEEKLGGDDAWLCPNCRRRQQGTLKSLSLWSLPDILVIHLKRFKQLNVKRIKLNTLITFPVTGLDMSQHIINRKNQQVTNPHWSPWRRHKQQDLGPNNHIYDLYAVCNHYGNMQGGHYTAFCKNPADNKWYIFDDSTVKETGDEQIVTRAAYLLFYQKRSLHSAPASRLQWMYNISQIDYTPRVCKSQEDLLNDSEMDETVDEANTTFPRSVQAYATLRTPKKALASPQHSKAPNTHLVASQSSGHIGGTWSDSPTRSLSQSSSVPSVGSGSSRGGPGAPKSTHNKPSTPVNTTLGMHPGMISASPSTAGTPTSVGSRAVTPTSVGSRAVTPTSAHSRPCLVGDPAQTSTPQGSQSHLASSQTTSSSRSSSPSTRPAAVSGAAVQAVHRGTFSTSNTASRKAHSLGRTASHTSTPTVGSQPATPTGGHPRGPLMTRSASMTSSTAAWAGSSNIMKESFV